MGFSRDWKPWVGAVPTGLGGGKGLFICAGFSGHGMPNASLCASAVATMMTGGQLEDGDLPAEYTVSEARAKAAALLEVVNGRSDVMVCH